MLFKFFLFYCLTSLILSAFFISRYLIRLFWQNDFSSLPDEYIERQKLLYQKCERMAHQLGKPWADRISRSLRQPSTERCSVIWRYLQKMTELDQIRQSLGVGFPLELRTGWTRELVQSLQRGWEGDKKQLKHYLERCADLESLGREMIKQLEKPWEKDQLQRRRFRWKRTFERIGEFSKKCDLWLNSYSIMGQPTKIHATTAHPRMRVRQPEDRRQRGPRASPSADRRQSPVPKPKNEQRPKSPENDSTQFLRLRIQSRSAPHEILGISATASEMEIKNAYRELVKKFHPDKVGAQGSEKNLQAQLLTAILNRAKKQMMVQLRYSRSSMAA